MDIWIASSTKPGRAGWAWINDRGAQGRGVAEGASAPRAELAAVVGALAASEGPVTVRCANKNLVETGRTWMAQWRAAGWRKKGGIANLDLVMALNDAVHGREVTWEVLASDDPRAAVAKERAQQALIDIAPPPPEAPKEGRPRVAASTATVVVYTDGGCRGNPGPGGWGALLVHVPSDKARGLRGGEALTTNNRMEMGGAIAALEAIREGEDVEIRTDSRYLADMATKWLSGWKRNGWVRKGQDGPGEIKNLDLVKRLDALLATHRVRWTWVKGHAGEPGNEFVDGLTNRAMDAVQRGADPAADERYERSPIHVPRPT